MVASPPSGAGDDIRALAGPDTRTVDLGGRTVIPGLIDSHIHAIRAGLTYGTEVHWIGARTLQEALGRIRAKAATVPQGSWLVVAGGWTPRQFAEDRLPTQSEIAAAAPEHRVYVQLLYSRVLLSPGGPEALRIADDAGLMTRIKIEDGPDGEPTGWLLADARTISELFDRLPRPSIVQQVAGTRAFFRALNALGLPGVMDPGGYNMPLDEYRALFQVWRERGLTIRVRYNLCAPRRGHELEDFKSITAAMPMGFGDDWLRFNGIGENVT
jgi:predicted amidohydrolase YtcJ